MSRPVIALMDSNFLHNPDDCGNHAHAASLSNAAGRAWAVWYGYPEQEHRDAVLCLAEHRHGTWSASRTIADLGGHSLGNPVLLPLDDDRLVLFFVNLKGGYWPEAELQLACSDDAGVTWTRPEPLGLPRGSMIRHLPRRTGRGWLLPAYAESGRHLRLLIASDPAGPWQIDQDLAAEYIQADLVDLGRDRWQLYARPTTPGAPIVRCSSGDGGATWSAPIPTTLDCPLSGLAAIRLGELVVVAHNATPEHRRTPLSLSLSRDSGLTFPVTVDVDQVDLECSYPSLAEWGDHLQLVYSHGRRRIKHVAIGRSTLEGLI